MHAQPMPKNSPSSTAAYSPSDWLRGTSNNTLKDSAMNTDNDTTLEGGCTCRAVRYRMTTRPLFVHCCHCRWCQRETGASFALNALIEADRVILLKGAPEVVNTPSNSGKGQKISPLSDVPHRSLEQLRGRRRRYALRARRHSRRTRSPAARYSYLHFIEATLGRASRRHARS